MKRLTIKKFFLLSLGLCLAGISGCGESQVSVTISPRNVTLPRDQNFPFTAEVSNSQDLGVTWSIDHGTNNSLGTIDDNGVYTPPDVIPTPNTVKIRVATDADSSATDTVSVAIVSGNELEFKANYQVTDYLIPQGIPCTANCTANTVSSGQHSVATHHEKRGKYDYTLIYTVWSDTRNGDYDVFFRLITIKVLLENPPPAPVITLSNTIKVNPDKSNTDPANPSLAIDNSGNVFVSWQSDRGPFGVVLPYHNVFVSKGTLSPFKDDTIPSVTFTVPDNPFSDGPACDKRAPSIAVEGSRVYVAWEDNRTLSSCGSDYTIRAAVGTVTETPVSYPILSGSYTGSGSQTEPSIGVYQSNLYAAWTGAQAFCRGICFAKGTVPTGSGTSWSTNGPVLVNDNTGIVNPRFPSLVVDPAGGGDNAGNVYVVWQDNRNGNYNIYLAKKEKDKTAFDAATDPNNPNVHNIQVNSDTTPVDHQHPSLVVERPEPNAKGKTSNKLYVVWARDGSPDIITAKSLDGGNSFWKNSDSANLGGALASDPGIAVDTFGRAYVIWTDERNSPGNDVFLAIGE